MDTFESYTADQTALDSTPLTKAIRQKWPLATATGAEIRPGEVSLRAFLDAVHDLERRVTALEP